MMRSQSVAHLQSTDIYSDIYTYGYLQTLVYTQKYKYTGIKIHNWCLHSKDKTGRVGKVNLSKV